MPFGGFVLLKALGQGWRGRGGERGRKQFPMLSPWLGRGRPEGLRLTKRQCGLVTVRGKHGATNGVVMAGEEPGKSWYKESWHINSGGVTSPLAEGQGPLFPLPSANARDVPAPREEAIVRDGWEGTSELGFHGPRGPWERMDRKGRAFPAEAQAPG